MTVAVRRESRLLSITGKMDYDSLGHLEVLKVE